MNKKEMIEEMANLCCWFQNRKCIANPGIDDVCDMSCEYGQACEALMSKGYRNCKDKVVLSKKEYGEYVELRNSEVGELVKENRELGKQCLDWMKLYHKQLAKTDEARKETAEKYFNAVIEMLKEVKQFETIDIKDLVFLHEKNKEYAKQFGVEVEE